MAVVYLNEQLNFDNLSIEDWQYLVPTTRTSDTFQGYYSFSQSESVTFQGSNFTYAPDGTPLGGVVTRFYESSGPDIYLDVQQVSIPVSELSRWVESGSTLTALSSVLNGNDTIYGSSQGDDIRAFASDDIIYGNGGDDNIVGDDGNDTLIGSSGSDFVDGGPGNDIAFFDGARKTYSVSFNGSTHSGSVSRSDGFDIVRNVEVISFDDGRLVFDVGDEASVAYRMYDSAFDRIPDPLGLSAWTNALQNGLSVTGMADGFAASSEFQNTYGNLSNVEFVELLYHNVLDRQGEATGVSHWAGLVNTGQMSRGEVLAGFSESAEHVGMLRSAVEAGIWDVNETAASVARLYYAAFDRAPDAGGLTNWTNTIEGGLPLRDAADGFVNSAEFENKYGALSNAQFVEQLYLNVLDRSSDPGGLATWTGSLNSGQLDRGDVLAGFADSLEHQIKTQNYLNDGIFLL